MSYTSLLVVPAKGPMETFKEYSNSHLSAPTIWSLLFDKYVPKRFEHDSWICGNAQALWNLADPTSPLTEYERMALTLTFDNMILRVRDIPLAVNVLRKINFDIMESRPDLLAPHWEDICDDLLDIYNSRWLNRLMFWKPRIIGVAFHWTSVSCDIWESKYPTKDEDDEYYGRYDISKDTGHWFMFEQQAPSETKSCQACDKERGLLVDIGGHTCGKPEGCLHNP
jgi:hypothetical protein